MIVGRAFPTTEGARVAEGIKMLSIGIRHARRASGLTLAALMLLAPLAAPGQTQIVAPKNKYSPQDDVKLGQQAARQVYQQMPILRDAAVKEYVGSVGRRLA